MKIGTKEFQFGQKVYIMGILNVTPDSFSDGGRYESVRQAMQQVERMIADGAHIIDVGGESTRPGHTPVSDEEEIRRIIPVIRSIRERYDIPISVDTYKSSTARAALDAGADLINDVWGCLYDENMAAVAAEYDAPVCLMHNRNDTDYESFLDEVVFDLQKSVALARKKGVKQENIILDPGIGFGKTYEQNLLLLGHLENICGLGYPVLLGASRKSVIGLTLGLPVEEREEGTLAISVIGAMKGCSILRVHDVKANVRALRMTEAIIGCEKEAHEEGGRQDGQDRN